MARFIPPLKQAGFLAPKPMNGELLNFGYAGAIVNDLVRPPTTGAPSPYYDSTLDAQYPGATWRDYYVYQAYLYAEQAVAQHCNPNAGDIVPKLSLNDKFPLDGTDLQWYQGTLGLMNRVNQVAPSEFIDGVGIQTHLTVYPYLAPTTFGSASNLRSILEAFKDAFHEVRITELDVGLERTPPNGSDAQETFTPTLAVTYFAQQGAYYDSVVQQCLYNPSGTFEPICEEITSWVLFDSEGGGWRTCEYASLFTPREYAQECLLEQPTRTPTPLGTRTPTPTFTPTPTGTRTPPPTATRIPVTPNPLVAKPAHFFVYKKLQIAPLPLTPTPPGAYPAPALAPRPNPTTNPYP